jgi:hypothetical protein
VESGLMSVLPTIRNYTHLAKKNRLLAENQVNLDRSNLPIAFVFCALLATAAKAQKNPQRQLLFSAPVTEARCREFPLEHFDIAPSGDRWNSKDLLNVRCESIARGQFALTLTFTVVIDGPFPPRGVRGEVFRFRWGKSLNTASPALTGQFTRNPDLCSRLAGALNSEVLKWVPAASARVRQPPELSSSCDPDDQWGTSMEVVLTANFSDHPI